MLSKKLQELRLQTDLTMKKVGTIVGVTESSMSLYESGKRFPSCYVLMALAKLYKVNIDWLLEEEFKE